MLSADAIIKFGNDAKIPFIAYLMLEELQLFRLEKVNAVLIDVVQNHWQCVALQGEKIYDVNNRNSY